MMLSSRPAFGESAATHQGFASYSRKDAALAARLLSLISTQVAVPWPPSRGVAPSTNAWWDHQIIVGKGPWRAQIASAIAASSFGVFLFSRNLVRSEFIRTEEVPPFMNDPTKHVFVVGLSHVDVANEECAGLDAEQIHLLRRHDEPIGRCFDQVSAGNQKEFASGFVEHMRIALSGEQDQ